jgi:hypothetical protein
MDPFELERLIDRELKQLPAPSAPRTLLPRVRAAVEQRAARPWYLRAWFTWPGPVQAVFGAMLVAIVAAGALGLPGVSAALAGLDWNLEMPMSIDLVGMPAWIGAAWDATRVLWRVLVQPIFSYVVMFVLVMSAACVAFGTALDRVALGGASES